MPCRYDSLKSTITGGPLRACTTPIFTLSACAADASTVRLAARLMNAFCMACLRCLRVIYRRSEAAGQPEALGDQVLRHLVGNRREHHLLVVAEVPLHVVLHREAVAAEDLHAV